MCCSQEAINYIDHNKKALVSLCEPKKLNFGLVYLSIIELLMSFIKIDCKKGFNIRETHENQAYKAN